jgi:hypothetical protein
MQRVVFTPEGPWMGESVGPLTTSMAAFVGNEHQQVEGGEKKQGHGIKGFFRKIKDEL